MEIMPPNQSKNVENKIHANVVEALNRMIITIRSYHRNHGTLFHQTILSGCILVIRSCSTNWMFKIHKIQFQLNDIQRYHYNITMFPLKSANASFYGIFAIIFFSPF